MRFRLVMSLGLLVSVACSNEAFDGAQNDDAGSRDDDNDAGHVDGGGTDGCDTTKLPTDDVCVINDSVGVFVSSSSGSASGDGTRGHPLASLDSAIALAAKNKMRVYACAETYAEATVFADGVSIFGYFDCQNGWLVTQSHAKVESPTSPAATASNIASPTRVEAVDLIAPDFTSGSQSSIALLANASPGLTIKNATIHAGNGGKGDDGVAAAVPTDSGSAKNGANANPKHACTTIFCVANTGGLGGTNQCNGNAGGNGGSGGEFTAQEPGPGTYSWVATTPLTSAGLPAAANTQTAQGGGIALAGTNGNAGANGTSGSPGGSIGVISASGYTPADGTAGEDGTSGQGGGGAGGYALQQFNDPDLNPETYYLNNGAGTVGWGESGAGGGAGGCAGLAGALGKGGGASIAIIAISSPLVLDTVSVQSSNGGDGGAAGMGSPPTSGGSGGIAYKYTKAAGSGGSGGYPGPSGNGGGGPSIGIASHGGSVQMTASTVNPGSGGNGVAARSFVNMPTIPASPSGLSQASYAF